MNPWVIVAATVCLISLLLTVGCIAYVILRLLGAKPRPLQDVVADLGAKFSALEIMVDELKSALLRQQQRDAKAASRARQKAAEEEEAAIAPAIADANGHTGSGQLSLPTFAAGPAPRIPHLGPPHKIFGRRV